MKTSKRICIFNLLETQYCYLKIKIIILASLRHRAISWYTNYLQHLSHSCLKETILSMMYWKGMHTPSGNIKSCRSCQKQETQSKGQSCTIKLVIMTPTRSLCVHLIRQYTLKGKDNTSIDFMCLIMIDPAISGFYTIKLPTVTKIDCLQ